MQWGGWSVSAPGPVKVSRAPVILHRLVARPSGSTCGCRVEERDRMKKVGGRALLLALAGVLFAAVPSAVVHRLAGESTCHRQAGHGRCVGVVVIARWMVDALGAGQLRAALVGRADLVRPDAVRPDPRRRGRLHAAGVASGIAAPATCLV